MRSTDAIESQNFHVSGCPLVTSHASAEHDLEAFKWQRCCKSAARVFQRQQIVLYLTDLLSPATSRKCSSDFVKQSGSTCLQHVPVQIAAPRIRPSCQHLTRSHPFSLVRYSDNLNFFEPMRSSLSSDRARRTLGSGRDDDDEVDPPCVTVVDNVWDVETASGPCSAVG